MWRSVLRAGAVVSAGVFIGRLTGFAREVMLAHTLGGGVEADVAVFALTLPDVFTNLLVAGAIASSLVPEFKAAPGAAGSLFRRSTAATLLVFGALAGAAALAAPLLVPLLAPGFPPDAARSAARLGAITLISIPLAAATAVSTAYLQARDRFVVPALGTLIFNAGILAVLAGWPGRLEPLAWGVVAAAGARWLPQLFAPPSTPSSGPRPPAAPIFRRYLEALGAFGVLVLVQVAGRAFASAEGEGALAAFNYAQKVIELPMGVAVGVLGVVLLPRFSELHERGAHDELGVLARQGLWLSWVLAVPATLGLAWFSGPVCDLLFGHGRMSPEAAARVGRLTAVAMLALPAQGFVVQLYALLSARRDTRRPLRAGLAIFALYLGGAWAAQRAFGLMGLVAAGAALQWAVALAYLFILRRHHDLDLLRGALARDLAVAALASAAAFAPVALWRGRAPGERIGPVAALGGGALALAAALALKYRTLPDGLRTFLKARPA